MYRNRIIPCLLLQKGVLVKTAKFKDPRYIGDPINAVKIFNDKGADELLFIDIEASKEKKNINFDLLLKIASQSFMPLSYGGGLHNIDDMKKIFSIGFEKISLNTSVLIDPSIVTKASETFGSQSVVVSIDVKKDLLGKYYVYNHVLKKNTTLDPIEYAIKIQNLGAGEILLNSVDNDGMMKGYDLELINKIASSLSIPVIALGGAGTPQDLEKAITAGASAAAAGSLFVFYGPNRAVLINYQSENKSRIY
jgi:imidazole glycerol-phosphate synthase subunit HisF